LEGVNLAHRLGLRKKIQKEGLDNFERLNFIVQSFLSKWENTGVGLHVRKQI
jgi:hypothetical protein